MRLYFTHYDSIMSADPYKPEQNNVKVIVNASGAVGLDYYSQKNEDWLFYTDAVKKKVFRTALYPGTKSAATTTDFRYSST